MKKDCLSQCRAEYRDIAHPINSETREKIQGIILQKYEQVLAEEPVEAEQSAE